MISVIIVTWNSERFIKKCLDTLLSASGGLEKEIIVIDNASGDNTIPIVKERFPGVRCIENEKNIGLSPALNQGIREAKGDYFLILNADTEIGPDAISKLYSYMERNSNVGVVGPKLVYPDGSLQYSCRNFPTFGTFLARGLGVTEYSKWMPGFLRHHLMMDFNHEHEKDVDWILGSCLMIRKEAVEDIGLFDEKFPLYYGDIDICYRMNKKGWRVVYLPKASAVHHYQRDSARGGLFNPMKWSHAKSAMRFFRKRYLYG